MAFSHTCSIILNRANWASSPFISGRTWESTQPPLLLKSEGWKTSTLEPNYQGFTLCFLLVVRFGAYSNSLYSNCLLTKTLPLTLTLSQAILGLPTPVVARILLSQLREKPPLSYLIKLFVPHLWCLSPSPPSTKIPLSQYSKSPPTSEVPLVISIHWFCTPCFLVINAYCLCYVQSWVPSVSPIVIVLTHFIVVLHEVFFIVL